MFSTHASCHFGFGPETADFSPAFDMSKAFDFVVHDLLLNKIGNYGIRGLPLILPRTQTPLCRNK